MGECHSLHCLANSFFFHVKSISSPGENVSGILPLPPNLPFFMFFFVFCLYIYVIMNNDDHVYKLTIRH